MNFPSLSAQTPRGHASLTDGRSPASSSGFQLWLSRWSQPAVPTDQQKLCDARRQIGDALTPPSRTMGPRDLRLYLRLMSEPSLAGLRRMRFDCFDLICRHLSEPEAVRRLKGLDACWNP